MVSSFLLSMLVCVIFLLVAAVITLSFGKMVPAEATVEDLQQGTLNVKTSSPD